jgi:hypothetical protein
MFWADSCATTPGGSSTATACAFGDTSAKQTVVLYGDSFALQWVPALNALGAKNHFKVLAYVRIGCPFANRAVLDYLGSVDSGCPAFRSNVVAAVNSMRPVPQLVLAAEDFYRTAPDRSSISSAQWAAAVSSTLSRLHGRHFPIGVILGIPAAKAEPSHCLAAHMSDVSACDTSTTDAFSAPADLKFSAAISSAHAYTVNVSMLLCGNSCPDVVHQTLVHADRWHLSAAYVQSLGRSFGSLVGCIAKRAPHNLVPPNGVLTRILIVTGRPVVTACRAAIASPFNL